MKIRKLLALSALALAAAAPLVSHAQQAVRVGSKNFTEQFVLAEIYAQALEAAGIKTEKKLNLGGTLIAQKAMEEKQIDFYPEYTGTMLLAVLKQEPMTDPKAVYDKVKEAYAKMGFVLLNQSNLNNGYVMVVRADTAQKLKLETLSDLAKVAKDLKVGAGPEFRDRKDGLPGLKAKYDMVFGEDLQMAIGLRYQALRNDQIQVVNGYSTDGMISAMKLKRLRDDKSLWPPYFVVPVIRKETLDANPKIGEVLNRVSALLDETSMAQMNYQVDGDKLEPKEVARDFLKAKGLVK
ncbi:MAG: glycine/betaine ABC transporter substrate-binding protein [Polaromonas sp.]|nr:glycine/betaine ABC transporter substrate-binding protein [Polaromonas sp.]